MSDQRPHARRTDPATSDWAVKAIAKNNSLAHCVWWAALEARQRGWCFNDTWLTEKIENQLGARQQRNVIARTRGLLEDAGMFRQIGIRYFDGKLLMHYEIDPNNPKEKQ